VPPVSNFNIITDFNFEIRCNKKPEKNASANLYLILKNRKRRKSEVSMTDEQLTEIFQRIHTQYLGRRRRRVEAEFHPYRSLRHTLEWTPWRIRIKVSQYFHRAPVSVLEYVAIILLSKVYRLKIDQAIRRKYREYLHELQQTLPLKKQRRPLRYNACGKVYDLQNLFDQINEKTFKNQLNRPHLGWSLTDSYRRLGFYDADRNLLVISRIFDKVAVPEKIVRYLLYHEMLHIYYPVIQRNGQRIIHSAQFKRAEHLFPDYDKIQHWIKSYIKQRR
jgi:predicted metal-dependent hydrolase